MRTCPNCKTEIIESNLHGEKVDRCSECGGIYFDKGELESIVKIVKIYQDVELDEPEIDTIDDHEKNRDLECPVHGTIMHKKDIASQIIDICPDCGGIWLDSKEISNLLLAEKHIRQNLNLYIRLGND